MKGDFSRWSFNPTVRYSSVRLQQGRVALDEEFNEQVKIDDRLRRAALTDIIGGCCIPASAPDSFRVSVKDRTIRVESGRMWVQGILCESSAVQVIPLPKGTGKHLVYLEIFEQHITGVEDPQIIEVALGGPDTANRTKTVVRALVAPVAANQSCATLKGWTAPERTTGKLTATTGAQPPGTPCVVPAQAGYTGLENQLYRVEVQRSGTLGGPTPPTFKWSRDNGSVLSPWLKVDGDELVLPSPGVDDVLGFQDNRWVELSHDGLDTAGVAGPLVEVIGRRTDSLGLFRLRFNAHGQTVPDPATLGHPKVRRWDQDQGSNPTLGGIPITAAGTPVPLESGVEVSFSPGFYRSGDHWMIPARTFSGSSTGDVIWSTDANGVAVAQPPHGVERFTCRLAVITGGGATAGAQVEDCRSTFPSLCGLERSNGCCTVTVGRAGADVSTITEALARLPEDGGEICVLPGDYPEQVILDGRHDISIHGCYGRTFVVGADDTPVFSLTGARNIRISSLGIRNLLGQGIRLNKATEVTLVDLQMIAGARSAVAGADVTSVSILDSRIDLVPSDTFDAQRPPAVFLNGQTLRIEGNRITAPGVRDPRNIAAGGIQVGGPSRRVVIRENEIVGGIGPGIALGSVSPAVGRPIFGEVFRTFAARTIGDPGALPGGAAFAGAVKHFQQLNREPGSTVVTEDVAASAAGGAGGAGGGGAVIIGRPREVLVSDGDVHDVLIAQNLIRGMGSSGITAAHFFDLDGGEGDFISVHGLEIRSNLIEDCVAVAHAPPSPALADDSALGGITLADVTGLVVRDNTIQGNGRSTGTPCCGVFVLLGHGLEFHRNAIRHNGRLPQGATEATLHQRGGIVVVHAAPPTIVFADKPVDTGGPGKGGPGGGTGTTNPSTQSAFAVAAVTRRDGTPALRIQDNLVIAPEGRALEIGALGSVIIDGNQLTSLGLNFRRADNADPSLDLPDLPPLFAALNAAGGAVVSLMNLGVSIDGTFPRRVGGPVVGGPSTAAPIGDRATSQSVLTGGDVRFSDNQVFLDGVHGTPVGVLSAVTITTLDDLLIADNQSTCELAKNKIAVNTIGYGWSLRMTSNRLKETPRSVDYSALTIGFMNTTTDNQGTHCFVRVAPTIPGVHQNTVVLEDLTPGASVCAAVAELERQLQNVIFFNRIVGGGRS